MPRGLRVANSSPCCTALADIAAPAGDYNLRTLTDMIQRFGTVTGLSDHTLDNTTAISSVAAWRLYYRETFPPLDRSAGGPDDSFSLEPADLEHLCSASPNSLESPWRSGLRTKVQ